MKKKKIAMVYCPYVRGWLPLGRARIKCPECGAVLKGSSGHKIRKR